jgi:hypothetical protein
VRAVVITSIATGLAAAKWRIHAVTQDHIERAWPRRGNVKSDSALMGYLKLMPE